MLLAVEGGGFFSSSASGYSKGLTLLLLGQKNEEKPMRVSPWNQYQLVDQDSYPDLPLASGKKRLVRGCASFVCFGRTAAGLKSPSPLKVGHSQKQEILPEAPVSDKGKDHIHATDLVDDGSNVTKLAIKSSLKKQKNTVPVSGRPVNGHEATCDGEIDIPGHMERRKVQWTDTSGGELAEIREFELSDSSGSDDEFDAKNERRCSCRIM
ncbi:uncharacterized protein LOC127808055 [Diospyros lotus]|uniref:uncharacterized protein LOC127808055 n=1 Tax=Diospyros lotus TaxID=55363 RepID=UPI0022572900|nr:uncharacterized protein LOC127808055 [Diospyros lotus]